MLINQTMIYTETHTIKNAKGIVIITHGIALHSAYYKRLMNIINKAGYEVVLYDVRGHGKSQGKRGDIKKITQFTDDLYKLVEETRKRSDLPIFLLGHSMGGIITNLYSTLYDDYAGSIILAAPTIPANFGILNIVPYQLLGFLKIPTNFKDTRLSDLPPSEDKDPYALKNFTLRLAGSLTKKAVKLVNKNIKNINKPILVINGDLDKLVKYQDSERFVKALTTPNKEFVLMNGGYHNLNNDSTTENVGAVIVKWLNKETKNI